MGFKTSKSRFEIRDYGFKLKNNTNIKQFDAATEVTIVDYGPTMFDDIYEYDKTIQPIERKHFVKTHIDNSVQTKVAMKNGKIVGYGCVRPNFKGFMLMPLYADDELVAGRILASLVQNIDDEELIKIGIPEGNGEKARKLFDWIGWQEEPRHPMRVNLRMETKSDLAELINVQKVYSVMNYSYVII